MSKMISTTTKPFANYEAALDVAEELGSTYDDWEYTVVILDTGYHVMIRDEYRQFVGYWTEDGDLKDD